MRELKTLRPSKIPSSGDGRDIDLPLEGVVGQTRFKVTILVNRYLLKNEQRATSNEQPVTFTQAKPIISDHA